VFILNEPAAEALMNTFAFILNVFDVALRGADSRLLNSF
jgi:hypothetical protein